ncbi:MAG TPA: aldehyde:ferredoxin oxidoreductase, partial [Desulfobacteraceae bacterium]|nr:aldehyde:ferredoxin oxidoreductase [Desulfobacteraceae bacterium]
MKGYYGRMLLVNVSDKSYEIVPLGEELLSATLGGKGLAAKLLLEHTPKGVDPLSPDNTL